MASINYLTVQDVLWINRQLTNRDVPFHFATLEEATFYQYGYGGSVDVVGQAGRLVGGFRKLAPFNEANEATAFVATLSFLKLNGFDVKLTDKDGAGWFERAQLDPSEVSEIVSTSHDHHGDANPRAQMDAVLKAFPKTLGSLLELAVA
jgi:prophage maintenance system killer protein